MDLSIVKHVEPDQLKEIDADLFITSLGYEKRGINIATRLEDYQCRKIALSHTDHLKEFSHEENEAYFRSRNFEIYPVTTDIPDYGMLFHPLAKQDLQIIFDATSMTQLWYHEFFRWLYENKENYASACIRIVYTLSGYVNPGPVRKVKQIRDFERSNNREGKKKNTALLLGLDHEEGICESIYHLIKPDLLYLFYSDPPVDKRFVEKLFVNNHALIESVSIRNLIAYPIRNGLQIYQNLIEVILPLRNDYIINIIPRGPKIFSIASMLAQLGYPDTRISYPVFKRSKLVDRETFGEPVILDVHFEGGE